MHIQPPRGCSRPKPALYLSITRVFTLESYIRNAASRREESAHGRIQRRS